MVNKPKNQGTAWESAIVRRAKDETEGHAARLPLRGVKGEPDLEIGSPSPYVKDLAAVFWKRLVKAKGKKKRVPDGTPEVVVMSTDDFWRLYRSAFHDCEGDCGFAPARVLVQAKATERLNVTRVLGELHTAIKLVF